LLFHHLLGSTAKVVHFPYHTVSLAIAIPVKLHGSGEVTVLAPYHLHNIGGVSFGRVL
jgi:hypothetical protein